MEFIKKLLIVFLGSLCLLSATFGALTDNIDVYWTNDNTLLDETPNNNDNINFGATYTS